MGMQLTPESTVAFPLAGEKTAAGQKWLAAWPDALAFALGLGVSWRAGWTSGDLIWSLWLSSLVVGYATIIWIIARPSIELGRGVWRDRGLAQQHPGMLLAVSALIFSGASFMLAFFTVHFGGFHYVHSQLLFFFFPIHLPGAQNLRVGWAVYLEVFRRYWTFLPSAFLAHRAAFTRRPVLLDKGSTVKSLMGGNKPRDLFAEPYRNVLRMHFLIFFFFLAHFLGLENFGVYAVIYAVYFFPWRLVRGLEQHTEVGGQ
jgi:hypothetical protein